MKEQIPSAWSIHLSIIIGLLFAAALKASGQITEDPGITYNPGEDCLPYDGSVVPDCTLYVDPDIKEPYYKEHSTSKFKVVKNIKNLVYSS